MKTKISLWLILVLSYLSPIHSQNTDLKQLPVYADEQVSEKDWMIDSKNYIAKTYRSNDNKEIILSNGLIKRSFRVGPDVACIDYKNMITGQQLLRAVSEEASVNIDGKTYKVGGLYGQKEKAYLLPEWIDKLWKDEAGFNFLSLSIQNIEMSLKVSERFWIAKWKSPSGKKVSFRYESKNLKDIAIFVNYEIYDGIPLICKYVEIENNTNHIITVNRVIHETLALVEEESAVVGSTTEMQTPQSIYFETNYTFNNSMKYRLSDQTTHWEADTTYTSQVNYNLETPCLLKIYPENVSNIHLSKGQIFKSPYTFELSMDSYDRERRGLAVRKMYRTIAPWTMSNPIFMHLVSKTDDEVYTAIDQCVNTGYEALILSFGSHLNMEGNTKENHNKWKKLADYAHSKGIKIGGYTLFSSRRIDESNDVINPKTGKTGGTFFGNAPCFGSKWGLEYAQSIIDFFDNTGFDILEMDGPYPGDICASKSHPGHEAIGDSQWKQMEIQKKIFHELNKKGVYINAPDWYFLDGTNKIALGYREVNFSLSREQQKILNRQNIYDATWEKTPSMGWGFVPLTAYHGGGKDAVLEPLEEHLNDYKDLMVQYYGAGIQACYRGPRLYDTEKTKQTVIETIDWYKKYRDILNDDIIHLRRADGRDWDGILHVSPDLKEKGFALIYNPTNEEINRQIKLPLYYTGLTKSARIAEQGLNPQTYPLDRAYNVNLTIKIKPKSYTWFVVTE